MAAAMVRASRVVGSHGQRRASKVEVAGGVFDGFGGDMSGGPVGVGGEVAQHRIEAELAVRLQELDAETALGRPPGEPRADLTGAMGAGHDQPIDAGCGGVGGCRDQAQPMAGGDGGPGGDWYRAGGERGGVDLERRGDVELADALGQPDADRRSPAQWCEGGEEVGEVTWRRPLRGDAGGAIQRPAGCRPARGPPAAPGRRPASCWTSRRAPNTPEVTPAVVVILPSWT